MTTCILLCGGHGTRLELNIPKALVSINNKTILHRRIDHLSQQDITTFILAITQQNKILFETEIKYILENIKQHINFLLSLEDENSRLGTSGAIKKAFELCKDKEALISNCDDITFVNIKQLLAIGTNCIVVTNPQLQFGVVKIQNNIIQSFLEKPILKDIWVSCGMYYLSKKIYFPDIGSIEYDVFPHIKLKCYKYHGLWVTVNTQKDIINAVKLLS